MFEPLREDWGTILFSLALVPVLVFAVLRDRRNPLKWSRNTPDPMAQIVARRNWSHSYKGPRPGRGRASAHVRVIGDKDAPEAWEVVITGSYRTSVARRGNDNPGDSIFRAPRPAFPGALAVFAAQAPVSTRIARNPLAGAAGMAQQELRRELQEVLGDTHHDMLQALRPQPLPSGNAITLFATRDPAPHFDLAEIARLLARWASLNPLLAPPRLVLDGHGMMLYMRQTLSDPNKISVFATMGLDLQATARNLGTEQVTAAKPPRFSEISSASRSSST